MRNQRQIKNSLFIEVEEQSSNHNDSSIKRSSSYLDSLISPKFESSTIALINPLRTPHKQA